MLELGHPLPNSQVRRWIGAGQGPIRLLGRWYAIRSGRAGGQGDSGPGAPWQAAKRPCGQGRCRGWDGYAPPPPPPELASGWSVGVPGQLHWAWGSSRDSVVREPMNPNTPWQRRARGDLAMRGAQAF